VHHVQGDSTASTPTGDGAALGGVTMEATRRPSSSLQPGTPTLHHPVKIESCGAQSWIEWKGWYWRVKVDSVELSVTQMVM